MRGGETAAGTPGGDGALLFRLLGPVRVGLPGGPAHRPGPPRRQAVLSVLLLRRRRPVTGAELVAAVWGDDAPASAAGNLRTHLWALRTLLEPGRTPREPARILLGDEHGYALHTSPESVDAWRFEQRAEAARQARARGDTAAEHALLAGALGQWSGEALAGVPGPFAEEERTRLAALRATARKRHIVCALRLGLHHTVIPELSALTREFPLDEELRALFMRALHGCGRRAEAFTVFADTHRTLGEELGVAPCPELTALHARLLADDPPPFVLRPSGPLVRSALPDAAERALTRAKSVLVEGEERGAVPVLVITGPGGAGKTALAARVADDVAHRFPDGRLSADLRTWGPVPAGPGPLLAHLLRALAVPASRIPADPDERAALYRSALSGRRVLVVLHGARDAAQVTPLLPGGPGSAVLLTTRSRVLAPALPAATRIELAARPYAEDPPPGEGTGGPDADVPDADVPDADVPGSDLPDSDVPGSGAPDTDAPDQGDLPPSLVPAARRLARSGAGLSSVEALAAAWGTDRADAALIAEALVDAGVLDTPAAGTYRLPARP
ncbi:AfsR/SARP family transcriptional regulator [Streptomyces flavotricini]|uniref:AfsR/SARP family transcriptional regulator n=1 Tax=Streptomyces flavotricini TaxID=66888 RepID=A0ABS8EGF0_9ACTN|nr:AfsR/SARP family transcriptional regulator [Streptomyces flavotricini]MCC0100158.1 AfsR/SARP family transcriptional regulator [Streptomyces flavotricini]